MRQIFPAAAMQKFRTGGEKFPRNLFSAARHILPTSAAERLAGSPASNPLLLKAQSRQFFIDLQQSLYKTTEITINSCNPKLGYHNSIFCKHDATIMRWWSVLQLSGTSSFW